MITERAQAEHPRFGLLALLTGLALAGCGRQAPALPQQADSPKSRPASNLLRGDFIGSKACASCHPAIYERWSQSPMHRMTRRSERGEVQAPFDGHEFRLRADVARMLTAEGQRYMELRSNKYGSAWYRITKVIGGRFREDYAGVRVDGPRPDAVAKSEDRILPISYLLFSKEWRYKGYSVLSPERDGLKRGLKWQTSCIFCHNTVPWMSLYYDELFGVGAPSYQGSASLKLPSERRLGYRIVDLSGFEAALGAESEFLGGEALSGDDLHELLEGAASQTRELFSEQHLVELGIGCEACHGGGRAHAAAPGAVLPSYTPRSEFLETTFQNGPVPEALAMSHSCAKCHTVLFSQYPHTWEGGDRGFDPGGSSMNSGEARDFLLGGCTSALKCTSCHDPHGGSAPEAMARLASVEGNRVCNGCHRALEKDSDLTRHTHHPARSQGSACVACHMPEKNVGLDYSLTRYHHIGSPTDSERVERDRPLECTLCHADKSVLELVEQMERLWRKRYSRQALKKLYGDDLTVNALRASLERGKAHEQVVALHQMGAKRRVEDVDLVIDAFQHQYPLVRFFARGALERIAGEQLPLDMHATGSELKSAAARAFRASARKNSVDPAASESPALKSDSAHETP